MGISFFQVSSRTPTKTGISECKFLVPHSMCSKDDPWKGIPYSQKKTQWFGKKPGCISCQYCLESNLKALQCYLKPLPLSTTGRGDFAPSQSRKQRSYFPIVLYLKCSVYYRKSIVTSYQSQLAYYNGI